MSSINLDVSRLYVFHEGRKRRVFVGQLAYVEEMDQYEFFYDKKYAHSKRAIPLGPELDLFKLRHVSTKGKLFPSLMDRVPLKSNPAYEEYCRSQGISPNENNLIILLGAIGKRGPSSFIFEPVYKSTFSIGDIVRLREQLKITQHDLALALDFSELTLQKIEVGKNQEANTLKRLQIYFEFPEVALWQLKQTGNRIHANVLEKLIEYFEHKHESLVGYSKAKS